MQLPIHSSIYHAIVKFEHASETVVLMLFLGMTVMNLEIDKAGEVSV